MLVCSCNVISRKEIESAIIGILNDDAWQLITPGTVYHALSKRGKCCGCFPNVIDLIIETTKSYHERIATPSAEIIPFIRKIRAEHERCETMRKLMSIRKNSAA